MSNPVTSESGISNNVLVGCVSVLFGIVVSLIGAYSALMITNLREKISSGDLLNSNKIDEVQKQLNEHRASQIGDLDNVFARLRDLEMTNSEVLEGIDWIKCEHRKNHS